MPPKPPRGTLGTDGRELGEVGAMPGLVPGVLYREVRVKPGRDQELLELVRPQCQPEREPHRSVEATCAGAGAVTPGGVSAGGQLRAGAAA